MDVIMTGRRRYRILQIGALALWADRGDSLHARELALALQEFNVEPVLLNLPGPPAPASSDLIEVRAPVIAMRFLRQFSWNILGSAAALVSIRRYKIKVIYTRMEPGIVVGLIAAVLGNRPMAVELNGLPSEDVRLYRPNNQLLLSVSRTWERLMYRKAARIIGSPGYIHYVQDHYDVPASKCVVAPLGVNTKVFEPRDRRKCLKSKSYEDVPTIVWAGAISGWQGLETLTAAAEVVLTKIPHARFIIVGQGLLEAWLRDDIAGRGLSSQVEMVGHVPYVDVNEYLGCASVCVGTFPGNRGDLGTISSLKTMTYLASGRPVVTSAMDEMGQTIQDAGAGFMVPPDDAKSLSEAIMMLLSENELTWCTRCKAARSLAEKQTWSHKAEIIAKNLDDLAGL